MALVEIENPNASVEIHFQMEGTAFKEGIPVHLMIDSLGSFQGILDKTYLGLTGKQRITRQDRARFFLRSRGVKHASLETDIGVIFTATQSAFPFFSALGPSGLWEYAKQSFDYLKFIFSSLKDGHQPTYQWTGDNSEFQVNTGKQTNTYNGPVFNIGQMSVNHYQTLSRPIQEKVVDIVRASGGEAGDIILTLPESELFDLPSEIDDNPIKLKCEIFDFNKFDNVGKLYVSPGQTITEGDYRFEVIGEQDVVTFIEAMLRKEVTVTCLKELSPNPFSTEKVVRLQVINVET